MRQPGVRRRFSSGSVTLMAIVVMVVLGIVVMSYLWIGQSTNRMLHHTYYQEKVLAIFEGLDVIARSAVQNQACLDELLGGEVGKAVVITPRVLNQLDSFGLLGEPGGREGAGVLAKKFKEYLKVEASLKGLVKMPDFTTIKSSFAAEDVKKFKALAAVNSPEIMGRVAIHIQLTDNIQLQSAVRDGKEQTVFTIPKRDVTMEYEFKRARVIPPYFRHFAVWIKNGITEKELPERFDEKGNYNWAQNPLTGKSATGGVLFVKAGDGHSFGPQGDFPGSSMGKGAFNKTIGYIYLGGKEKAHLNLMAGDIDKSAPYSETFHLYRGITTDFYKVWSTEFSNFVEKSEVEEPGKDAPANPTKPNGFQRTWDFITKNVKNALDWLKGAIKRALDLDNLEQGNKNASASNALPLYYVVRKDYGYAVEWGEPSYQRFGFARGGSGDKTTQTIISSSLHLYGANTDGSNLGVHDPQDPGRYVASDFASPTCVLGNVYRRCLSLSGYKQRRKGDSHNTSQEDQPSSDRKFEVQAGPIEFFEGYNDLMGRTQDPTQEKEKKPVWVWDARVRWNQDPNAASATEGNGTYLPLSGAGLFGRLIPGLAKLWEGDKMQRAAKLFDATVAPPKEADDAAQKIVGMNTGQNATHLSDQDDNTPMFAVGLSPLFQVLGQSSFFDPSRHPPGDGYLYSGCTPYFEELLRCFSFSVSGLGDAKDAIKKVREEANKSSQPVLTNEVEKAMTDALEGGKRRWMDLMENKDGIRDKVPVKEMKAEDIKDEKMKKYWVSDSAGGGGATAGGAPKPNFFPWSLPDPWNNQNKPQSSTNKNFRDTFEQWVTTWPVDKANTPADFFKLYFTPLMTNPARVLPYNYSLRFICTDLREIFSLQPAERKKLLMETFPAEVCDGIGYIEKGGENGNDWYLSPELYGENNDMPLNDQVLQKIYEGRKGKKRLEEAYYFMDEYGTGVSVPSAPSTEEVYAERSFWQNKGGDSGGESSGGLMTWEEASRRFLVPQPNGSNVLYLNTILGLADGKVELGKDGDVTINGGGAIIVPGELVISGDIKASKSVFLVAEKITIGGNAKIVQAGLIAHKSIYLGGSPTETLYIFGNVIAGEWDKSAFTKSGKRVIAYNPAFKTSDDFIVNIEPRIRKYSSNN